MFPCCSSVWHGATAEANEGAIKAARKYGREKKGENCNQIITLKNSFHGRTVTTLAATGQDSFHQYFFYLQKGSGMWRRTIDGNCRRCAREIVEKEIIYE